VSFEDDRREETPILTGRLVGAGEALRAASVLEDVHDGEAGLASIPDIGQGFE
jgi:hypothetical protein